MVVVAFLLATVQFARADSWADKKIDFTPKEARTGTPAAPAPDPKLARPSPMLPNDILVGAKVGFQHAGFTDVLVDGKSTRLTTGIGLVAGVAVHWNLESADHYASGRILGLPRLEFDLFYHARKQGDRAPVPYIGIPVLFRYAPVQTGLLAWEFGAGIQPDFALGGGSTRRNVLFGVPVSTQLLIDLGVFLTFELRYVLGVMTFDGGTTGGRPRDLDFMAGWMFPIDRPEDD